MRVYVCTCKYNYLSSFALFYHKTTGLGHPVRIEQLNQK